MRFDRIAILDWSAANQPRRGKDSIWLGLDTGEASNPPTRSEAFAELCTLVEDSLTRGQSLLIGADFAFGYPLGFARAVTGRADPLAVWALFAERLQDGPDNRSNRFEMAAGINAMLPGLGPFWFNASKEDLPALPRKGKARFGHGFDEHRLADATAKGAQSVWKLGGAGAVGSQVLTGLPMLHRLRRAFPGRIAVWPFEAPGKITLAEVFPSILAPEVAALMTPGLVKDQVQVTTLARALYRLPDLSPLLKTPQDMRIAEEGWILGLGHEAALRASL
ncbi:molybdopterin guanine dinucleotide synthesis [Cereibacter sphaeroides]|nr:molybdopterin guanine dinucleotide synthesis [Cereibacter sphaeroides]